MALATSPAEATGYHAFEDDGEGRCAVRPMGHGQYPVCGQWEGNDVHVMCVECGLFPALTETVGGARHLCQQCLDRARRAFTR